MLDTIEKRRLLASSDLTSHEGRLRVKKFEAVALYYIHRGRNAWHETWARHYFPWSFHPSLASAKMEVERHREQGSVFHIHELPALAIHTRNQTVTISQIGAKEPLELFSPEALYVWDPKVKDYVGRLRTGEFPLRQGITLNSALKCFDVQSFHWHDAPAHELATTIELWESQDIAWETLKSDSPVGWKSKPHGSEYTLGWEFVGPPRFCGTSVRRIARSAQRRASGSGTVKKDTNRESAS